MKKRYVCELCGYEYNSADGDPDNGIQPDTDFEELPEDLPDDGDATYASCVRLDVESALAALPLGEREAVSLHLSAGLKFREIAKILGVPLSTVFSRYDSAIKKLRQML